MGLTEQQKEAVLATRHDLLSRMTSVLEERQSLVNSLQVTHLLLSHHGIFQLLCLALFTIKSNRGTP